MIMMNVVKTVAQISLSIVVLSSLAFADARPQVTGYNQNGQRVTVPGLNNNEGCPESGSVSELKFVDACLAAKAQTVYTQSCDVLCSVDVTRPQVTGYNQNGKKVTVPGLKNNEGCPESGSVSELKFVDACLAAKAQTVYTQNCESLCSVKVIIR
jgi:hypothetical protein